MSNPSYWTHYTKSLSSASDINPELANFAARYRFAKPLNGLLLTGYSAGTAKGYLVATRLSFAFTALEALEQAIGVHHSDKSDREPIVDFEIAAMLARGDLIKAERQILDAGDSEFRRGKIAQSLRNIKLAEQETGNVRAFVEGFRNATFHGKFTPHKSGLDKSASLQAAIDRLADEVLKSANDHFTRWTKARIE